MHSSTLLAASLASFASARAVNKVLARDHTSDNWCGAVTTGSDITEVEGYWTVPTVSLPSGGDSSESYYTSQWVGIDGTSGCNALLQAGTEAKIVNGEISYYTWTEFYPASPINTDLGVSAGDSVYVKVTATSSTAGTIYLENRTTGKSTTVNAQSPGGKDSELCFGAAEWILEDPGTPGNPVPFPDFTSIDFTGCSASTSSGSTYDLSSATDWTLYSGSTRNCHADIQSSSDVKVTNN